MTVAGNEFTVVGIKPLSIALGALSQLQQLSLGGLISFLSLGHLKDNPLYNEGVLLLAPALSLRTLDKLWLYSLSHGYASSLM